MQLIIGTDSQLCGLPRPRRMNEFASVTVSHLCVCRRTVRPKSQRHDDDDDDDSDMSDISIARQDHNFRGAELHSFTSLTVAVTLQYPNLHVPIT